MKTDDKLAIASEIIKGRERLGLTQAQLAAKSELSISAIKGYETGRNYPGTKELRQLCIALQITPNLLLFGDENPFEGDVAEKLASVGEFKGPHVRRARVAALMDLLSASESLAVYSLVQSIAQARHGEAEVRSRLEFADLGTGLDELQSGHDFDPRLFRLILNDPATAQEVVQAMRNALSQVPQEKA